jgi:hypothetical protein
MPLRPFIDGPDDRQDDETRGRIREIQAGLLAWQARVDHRYRRVVWLVVGVAGGESCGPIGPCVRGEGEG